MAETIFKPMTKEEFDTLTPAQKRVEIARDVIAQLNTADSILAKGIGRGGYVMLQHPRHDWYKTGDSLQEILNANRFRSCSCCAKGALFLDKVMRFNEYNIQEDDCYGEGIDLGGNDTVKGLNGIFEENQLHLIESAFESSNFNESDDYEADRRAVRMFFGTDVSPKDRMIAICENIVANEGQFVP